MEEQAKQKSEERNKTTALYCRVSTGNQGTGLESQVRALRQYCTQRGIEHFLLFQDENQSGVKASRPALDKMMKSVRAREIDRVIVYSFSRYARSTSHLLAALEEFKKLGVEFVSISENIETNSPLGVAIFAILGAVAQLERDILIERVKNGLANAKAKGVKLGRAKTRDSDLIRTLYKNGVTYREISRIAQCSSGAVSAEVRELKKELSAKKELEAVIKARELASIQTELASTRARLVHLEGKSETSSLKVENVLDAGTESVGSPIKVVI